MTMNEKKVALCITGGIAAYKSAFLASLLVKSDAKVLPVMTDAAKHFIGEATLQAISGGPVYSSVFDSAPQGGMGHIEISKTADLVIIAPATANTIAKLAAGIADNLVTSLCLATRAPILVCPAMNVNMYENPVTQKNIGILKKLPNFHILGPAKGWLACGDAGPGRMVEPEEIFNRAQNILSEKPLMGMKLLVTAGPTREAIDAVRYISNFSTGKMGFLIAEQAERMGAKVTLISGPTSITPPACSINVFTETAREMFEAVKLHVKPCHAVIMTAAVADFTPANRKKSKIKKSEGIPDIKLKKTDDILAWLGKSATSKFIIGFAAEYEKVMEYALEKLAKKGCDLLVANLIGADDSGFGSDTDRAVILDNKPGGKQLKLFTKEELAKELLYKMAKSWDIKKHKVKK